MKAIVICYALMMVMCVIVGIIGALMKYSLWWSLMFLCPFVWSFVPQSELRNKIQIYPEFSSAFLVASFAVLAVAWVAVMLPEIKFDTFISRMSVISVSAAFLVTIVFIMLIPQKKSTGLCAS